MVVPRGMFVEFPVEEIEQSISPEVGVNPGALWLAARTMHAQAQIKSLASGSVVDSTFPKDMESVILPPLEGIDGEAIVGAWVKFADAAALKEEAKALVDQTMAEASGIDVAGAEEAELGDIEPDSLDFDEDE